MIRPKLELECGRCAPGMYRPPRRTQLEAILLHTQVEHDTDDVSLMLAAVCTCGATMTFRESRPTGGGHFDYFACAACSEEGRVKRGVGDAPGGRS